MSGPGPLGDLAARSAAWAGLRSGMLDVRGTSVHVVRGGLARADGGDPVPHVLVHGLGGGATNWFEVMPLLGGDREVITVDLPGFGRTVPPRTSAARVRANARFLPALLDTLGVERAILHGNSMGGTLITLMAALAPERIDRVVLAAPALPTARADLTHLPPLVYKRFAPFVVPGMGTAVLRAYWARATVDQLMEEALALVVNDPSTLTPGMLEVMRENLGFAKRTPWRIESLAYAVESLVAALLGGRELAEGIAALTPRTLVVWGDRDRLVGRPVIEHLRTKRPDWRYAVLPGVGHVPMMEAPQRYADSVEAWLLGRPVASVPGVLAYEDAPVPVREPAAGTSSGADGTASADT
jgi:pimeloyl-ACP methyl ester carboxylesterase